MTEPAAASLFAFSSAACPPRLNIPTLYPVLPRFRVGIASKVAGLYGRLLDCGFAMECALATSGRAADPRTAAVAMPPVFRKVRRLLDDLRADGLSDIGLFTMSPLLLMPSTLRPEIRSLSRKFAPALAMPPPGHGFFLNLSRSQHPADDRRVELVLALLHVARIVIHSQDKNGQAPLFIEVFFRHGDGKNSVQSMLAVRRLVAMLAHVPGKHTDLIEIVRQAVVRIGQHAQILRDLLRRALTSAGILRFSRRSRPNPA